MWLHLADCSPDRGQYRVLAELDHRACLLSFAYSKAERHFAPYWEAIHQMHLHLAGIATYGPEKLYPEVGKRLDSFAYPAEAHKFAGLARPGARLLIDSGAFTAYATGKAFRPEQYVEWALDFKRRWEPRLSSLQFFNLDVIGDQEASWRNQATIERLGLDVIPIVTYGAELTHLERALDGYGYVALGGLVGLARDRKRLSAWLDRCFGLVAARYKATGVMPRIHLLGLTQAWALDRYPVYSCDSSSWVSVLRYGGADAIGRRGQRFPRASLAPEVNVYALRQEVKRYQALEAAATAKWARRGITWEV